MSLADIRQKAKQETGLLKNKKWTKGKAITIGLIGLLVIFLFVFFNGKNSGSDYIKVGEQDYVEKIVAVGQLGMENQTSLVSQVSGKINYIGAEAGGTVSAGSIILSIENPEQTAQTEQKKSAWLDVQEQYNSLVDYDYVLAKEDLDRDTLLKQQAKKASSDAQTLYNAGAISQDSLADYQNSYQSALNQWSASKLKFEAMGPGGSKRNSLYYKMENAKSVYDSSVEDEANYKMTMDWDSVILASYFKVNDTVKSGDLLLDIGQAGSYHAVADLDEKYFLYISKGMKADINVEGQGKASSLKGEIAVITPKINKSTGTFQVEIKLLSPLEFQASDLTVNIEIALKETPNAIVVPKQYLIGDESFVFLYRGGSAVKTEVEIERGPSSNIIIKKGLKAGDIVLLPTDSLKDGDSVKLKKGVEPA